MSSHRTVTLFARGHPNVKATHAKTLEWVAEPDLGPRGTCIVGVGLEGDLEGLARLRGRARFVLRCGGRQEAVVATLNPAWLPGEPPILRTRAQPLARRTLAFAADKGAAGLDRAFVHAMADPQAGLEVEVASETGEAVPGALFLAHPAGAPDARLWQARALADLHLTDDLARLDAEIEAGGRVLLETRDPALQAEAVQAAVAAGGLATLAGAWAGPDGALALAGLQAEAWLHAEAPPPGGRPRRAALDRLRRGAEAARAGVVLPVPAGRIEAVLADAAKAFGERAAALVVDPGGLDETVRRRPVAQLAAERAPAGASWVVLAPPAAFADERLDPALLELVLRLRQEGVPTKSLAAALASVVGMPKREAFDLIVRIEEASTETSS